MDAKARGSAFAKPAPEIGHPVTNFPDDPRFHPLPHAPEADFSLSLEAILPGVTEAAEQAGALAFHALGDTGGIHGAETQNAVAAAMQEQIAKSQGGERPRFLFHLGDVVYLSGESSQYVAQFYEPYQYYDAPIFAIPGNHDGETTAETRCGLEGETALLGFMQNFCSASPRRLFKHRSTMTQPYCYWRLAAPFVHVIGLYSNIDGQLDRRGESRQQEWFIEQLRSAPDDKWLIVAAHHPCFSLDETHGGYVEIMSAMDAAFRESGRTPDLILSGHVHAYQRFSRDLSGKALPYIVAGNGGFANSSRSLHKMQRGLVIERLPFQTALPAVRLESYDVMNAGFVRVTAGSDCLTVDYFSVSFDDPPAVSREPRDSVTVRSAGMKTAR
ncbi:metallophosphoesterase [Methylocystis sp. Sn-Cys]|uniref:metallophosphoesterase family protein n=1 Tax=Methylocystis sp. Sn-Cys TaxID=1701263 RepID=UPI00192120C1|nr:metallophosphoesterase [Methylocystis sp. Sn-Cys]